MTSRTQRTVITAILALTAATFQINAQAAAEDTRAHTSANRSAAGHHLNTPAPSRPDAAARSHGQTAAQHPQTRLQAHAPAYAASHQPAHATPGHASQSRGDEHVQVAHATPRHPRR